MTFFEHAMVGINGAMATNLHRRHGWPIVAMAGAMAMLPDWDGLTILLNWNCYAQGHRVWGHNLLVAGTLAIVLSGFACHYMWPSRIRQWLGTRCSALAPREKENFVQSRMSDLWLWLVVGVLAAYSHLLADILFSGGRDGQIWGVPLGWPFSSTAWAYPVVLWGDVTVTLLFVIGMFAMLRWPIWRRAIAACVLTTAVTYIAVRGFCGLCA